MSRKTIIQSISFQPDSWEFIKENPTSIVNEAIREFKKRRITPEQKVKILREQKKELAKKIYQIDEEIKVIESELN